MSIFIRLNRAVSILLSLAALCTSAGAVTRIVNVTLDVTKLSVDGGGTHAGTLGPPGFTSIAPFAMAVGDTLDYTIDFLGLQTLTINNLGYLWPSIYANTGGNQNVSGTGSVQLLSASGAVMYAAGPKTDTESNVHFGQYFYKSEFGATMPNSITFGGVHYVGTVSAYAPVGASDPVIASRNYYLPSFEFTASSFTSAVPEPSTPWLILGGLSFMIAHIRKHRAQDR